MSLEGLQQTLTNLSRRGTLIKDRGYRQIWRFEHDAKPYYLKFYPRRNPISRVIRGNPALHEFRRLQAMQKAAIPAPRPIALLVGFRLAHPDAQRERLRLGDAVLLEGIEPSIQLDKYVNQLELEGEACADHREISIALLDLVEKLGRAGLGHRDLHLGNFLLTCQPDDKTVPMRPLKLHLLDGYAVRPRGMVQSDLLQLGHSVNRFATKSDILRGWIRLAGGADMPVENPISPRQWRKFIERSTQENRYFGRFSAAGNWRGVYFKHFKCPYRWSPASRLNVSSKDWQSQWPDLLNRLEADVLTVLKRSRSGDVLAGEIVLDNRPIEVIIKRPRRRYWYRYLNEIGRGARPRRAWRKAWNLIVRDIPTAWPLLMMEKRVLGYVVDTLIVFERIPGQTLATADLDGLEHGRRDMLFRRIGHLLRKIDQLGFAHFDAKPSNWVVREDARLGPGPILIDVDGIRRRRWIALGIQRLLRGMKEHPQYSVEDSLALCQGYAPYSRLEREESDDEATSEGSSERADENSIAAADVNAGSDESELQ